MATKSTKTTKKTKAAAESKATEPKVTVGSHLTVIEHADGRRELKWDDEALNRDVRAAIASLAKKTDKK